MIGDAGLTEQVIREIEATLRSHELIKIRALGEDRAARDALVSAICAATGAQPVQQIGKIIVIYRAHPLDQQNHTRAVLDAKARRRPKRSFQDVNGKR
jgi:RNA-binding protein